MNIFLFVFFYCLISWSFGTGLESDYSNYYDDFSNFYDLSPSNLEPEQTFKGKTTGWTSSDYPEFYNSDYPNNVGDGSKSIDIGGGGDGDEGGGGGDGGDGDEGGSGSGRSSKVKKDKKPTDGIPRTGHLDRVVVSLNLQNKTKSSHPKGPAALLQTKVSGDKGIQALKSRLQQLEHSDGILEEERLHPGTQSDAIKEPPTAVPQDENKQEESGVNIQGLTVDLIEDTPTEEGDENGDALNQNWNAQGPMPEQFKKIPPSKEVGVLDAAAPATEYKVNTFQNDPSHQMRIDSQKGPIQSSYANTALKVNQIALGSSSSSIRPENQVQDGGTIAKQLVQAATNTTTFDSERISKQQQQQQNQQQKQQQKQQQDHMQQLQQKQLKQEPQQKQQEQEQQNQPSITLEEDPFEHAFQRIKTFDPNYALPSRQDIDKITSGIVADLTDELIIPLKDTSTPKTAAKTKKVRQVQSVGAYQPTQMAPNPVKKMDDDQEKAFGQLFGSGVAVGMVIAVFVGLLIYAIYRIVMRVRRGRGIDLSDLGFGSMKDHKLENNPMYVRLSQINHRNTGNHYIVSILDDPAHSENELSSEEEEILNTHSSKHVMKTNKSNNSRLISPAVTIPAAFHERMLNVLKTPPYKLKPTSEQNVTSAQKTSPGSSEEEVFNIANVRDRSRNNSSISAKMKAKPQNQSRSARRNLTSTPLTTPPRKRSSSLSMTSPFKSASPCKRQSPYNLTPNKNLCNASLLETWRKQNKANTP